MSKRGTYVATVIDLMRTWYRYGGRERETGLDCFGCPIYIIRKMGGPDMRTWWTGKAFKELPKVERAEDLLPGDLIFYGDSDDPEQVDHVMSFVCEGVVVGSCGGDHTTLSMADAKRMGARVKVKESYQYRRVKGFRRIPFLDT